MIRLKIASLLDMRLLIIGLIFMVNLPAVSQDGSDIIYMEPESLNNSHLGKICRIDFGTRSKIHIIKDRILDTIQINIKGKIVSFIEHRVDNHYNNWFSQQYLEALPLKKHSSTRLTDSRIDSLTATKIYVTSFISYYRYESPLDTITMISHSYLRKNVAEILFKAKRK